jgi:tetratricopeptide (TPR) repeat protein
LISGDVDTFYQTVHQLSGEYAPIASDLLANLTTYSAYKQAPQHFAPAIHLAQQSLKLNPDYTLGLQIMAYGRLMTHEWSSSKSYLTQLMTLDPIHLVTYQRLYGIASYRNGEYRDAVQYLTQVQEKIPNIELLRYIGLSYRELQDYSNLTTTYRAILEDKKVDSVDYFEFFDTYRRLVSYSSGMILSGGINPIDQYDNTLMSDYITSCATTMVDKESYLCDYGRSLQLLFAANIDQAMEQMIIIAHDHPYDFVYGMIGDLYVIKDQLPTAEVYYRKAIESSYNG